MNRSHKGKGPPQRLKPCMPALLENETIPLSRENGSTNYGGTACENLVKTYFLSKGINVSEPYVDDGVDLLIEKPQGWVRGQVKKIVYQLKLDYTHKRDFGGEIYRSRFNFNFQSGGNATHLKNGRKQRGPETSDYFYHVLLTPHRQLIWETPVNLIPLRDDGTFIHGKSVTLDRDNWIRKKAEIDFNQLLIYSQYDPIIFKSFPDFFLKEEPNTLDEFFNYDK
jgi:hypothetical protein